MALKEQILEEVRKAGPGGILAKDIAQKIGSDKKTVNSALYKELRGSVSQKPDYKWTTLGKYPQRNESKTQTTTPEAPKTTLSKLCQYYLACLGDDALDVSAFSSSKYGDPDYAELESLPLEDNSPFASQAVRSLLGRSRKDRNQKNIYLGFPVRLKHVKSRKTGWEGYIVSPIFLYPLEQDSQTGGIKADISFPIINQAVISSLTNSGSDELMHEILQLEEELGLTGETEPPDIDDIFLRLREIRPEWSWVEECDPHKISSDPPLSDHTQEGIYNRALVIMGGERPPYTQGLESELKLLSKLNESEFAETALGKWLKNAHGTNSEKEYETLLEVLPLNTEQRLAVKQSLISNLTVITGPPGTGKSQVVTDLLINAAWNGTKVLFASKNNKAVDVVEQRVNNLGSRPTLLRIGSSAYQSKLAEYLLALLSTQTTAEDELEYKERSETHALLSQKSEQLEKELEKVISLRNLVDLNEQAAEAARQELPTDLIKNLDQDKAYEIVDSLEGLGTLITDVILSQKSLPRKILWLFNGRKRIIALKTKISELSEILNATGLTSKPDKDLTDLSRLEKINSEIRQKIRLLDSVSTYKKSLEDLQNSRSITDIERDQFGLTTSISRNSEALWKAWVNTQPGKLSAKDREELSKYKSTLKMVLDMPAETRMDRATYSTYKKLSDKVAHILTTWATTSLAAKGKIPFQPNHFDLVVFDEASQCDIASALPLLFRAKRAVIIGDPMQLSHISQLAKGRDQNLLKQHELLESHPHWAYSYNSLYDLASSMAHGESLVTLRDHHRSHEDIIGFSNKFFYKGKLRIATNYGRLRTPKEIKNGARWINVVGKTIRPDGGGAMNMEEAKTIINELRNLILEQAYEGTVGVVSPFRAQANLIKRLVQDDGELSNALISSNFLADTVHKFQGDERDIMFFSSTISIDTPQGALSFLKNNGNLFNVAITRARAMLIVVGDQAAAMASGVKYIQEFAAHIQNLEGERKKKDDALNLLELDENYPAVASPEKVSDWEKILYKAMFKAGIRTIPQYPIDKYELDFALFLGDRKLNIEVDGERYHRNWDGELCRSDQIRNNRMFELGWDVMRFWVYEIRDDMDGCIKRIKEWMR